MDWWVTPHTKVGTWRQFTKLIHTQFMVAEDEFIIQFQGMEDTQVLLTLCEAWWT